MVNEITSELKEQELEQSLGGGDEDDEDDDDLDDFLGGLGITRS
jgi:hypothetical protein